MGTSEIPEYPISFIENLKTKYFPEFKQCLMKLKLEQLKSKTEEFAETRVVEKLRQKFERNNDTKHKNDPKRDEKMKKEFDKNIDGFVQKFVNKNKKDFPKYPNDVVNELKSKFMKKIKFDMKIEELK